MFEKRIGAGSKAAIACLFAAWLAGCSGSDPGEQPAEPPATPPALTEAPAAAAVEAPAPAADDSPDEETRWTVAVFAGVDGEFGGLGGGTFVEDGEGRTRDLAIEYRFDADLSRIVMRGGRLYMGTGAGRTNWLDITDQVGRLSETASQLVRAEESGFRQLREMEYAGERFRVYGKFGDIVALDSQSAMGSRFLYWEDESGTVRRHVSIVNLRIGDKNAAIVTVADRDDQAALPDWHATAAQQARFSAVRAAPALRHTLGMPQPIAGPPSGDDPWLNEALDFFIAPASAQDIAISVAEDLGDTVIGDLVDATVEDFWQNMPPPGSSLSDYLEQVGYSGYNAIRNYFTPEQIRTLLRGALENALKKIVERSLLSIAPYLGYYGLAAWLAGEIVDDLIDWLKSSVHGEPHINLFDGGGYGFQAIGEFVYFQTPDFEVQQRFEGSKGQASWAQATAIRVGDRVIESYFESPTRRPAVMTVVLDGEETELTAEGISFPGGGYVSRLAGESKYHNFIVVEPGGSYVVVENLNMSQNVEFGIAADRANTITGGLGGVPDGNRSNDFMLRDGTVLDRGSIDDIENLYGRFAGSWRVRPEERLFTRGEAADFLTPEYTDLPASVVRLEDFSAEQRQQARTVCADAGVVGPQALEDCMYDVLVTGDPAWAETSASSQVVQAMEAPAGLAPPPATATPAPAPAPAGPPVPVRLDASGAATALALQWVVINRDTEDTLLPPDSGAGIDLMLPPGTYDVIVTGDGVEAETVVEVVSGSDNRFDIPLASSGAERPFEAPASAPAGELIRFAWRGPGAEDDVIFIAPLDMEERRYRTSNNHDATNPAPAEIVTPAVPGQYEIRYFSYANGAVLNRQPIEITAPQVEITAPAQVPAGTEFEAAWTGPGLPRDGLFVASPDMDASRYWTGNLFHDVEDGTPANLIAPAEPGNYEIRYYSRANGQPLVRVPIEVLPAAVEIDAPRTVSVGASFEFSWRGPAAEGDFLFLSPADLDANRFYTSGRHRVSDGPTGSFVAPAEPGNYEIRYYSSRNASLLARRVVVVR